ncbi:unnamed protein product [Polarella glacialis]|uniref:Uncharacterized protein n=1 Tax=Polarella glacialis TaxID=89957 RepID=A0A813G9P9_POLGL|nr:unnamed protein product [Polarella glacialis]
MGTLPSVKGGGRSGEQEELAQLIRAGLRVTQRAQELSDECAGNNLSKECTGMFQEFVELGGSVSLVGADLIQRIEEKFSAMRYEEEVEYALSAGFAESSPQISELLSSLTVSISLAHTSGSLLACARFISSLLCCGLLPGA